VKNVNGVKDIEAEEVGRKVKIHDDPDEGIEMSVTEKKDVKEVTKVYKAKNAEELKEKHPEAANRHGWSKPVCNAVCAHGLIPDMARGGTHRAFLLDVGDFPVGPDFSVSAGHAPTSQRREPHQSNQAHGSDLQSFLSTLGMQAACPKR
jgi:hypothetical protein